MPVGVAATPGSGVNVPALSSSARRSTKSRPRVAVLADGPGLQVLVIDPVSRFPNRRTRKASIGYIFYDAKEGEQVG